MDKTMGVQWLRALGWKNRIVSSNTRICSDHFEECYKDRSLGFKVRLRKDAIPTIFDSRREESVEEETFGTFSADSIVIDCTEEMEDECENKKSDKECGKDESEEENSEDFEAMYKNQCRLVQGLYQELQMSENECNGLRKELEELEIKFSKLQNLMQLMTPFERLIIENEVFPEGPSDEIHKFASSLYNISPLAYDFVQKSLLTSLPDVENLAELEEL